MERKNEWGAQDKSRTVKWLSSVVRRSARYRGERVIPQRDEGEGMWRPVITGTALTGTRGSGLAVDDAVGA